MDRAFVAKMCIEYLAGSTAIHGTVSLSLAGNEVQEILPSDSTPGGGG